MRYLALGILPGILVSACQGEGPESLDCSEDGTCPEGYSCRIEECIANNSLSAGESCTESQQCTQDQICATRYDYSCHPTCTDFLGTEDCGFDEFCLPLIMVGRECDEENPCLTGQCRAVPDTDLSVCHWYAGICAPDDACSARNPCSEDEVCVDIGDHVTICLTPCEIDWFGVDYTDNCGSEPEAEVYCTPLGAEGEEQLVCLPVFETGQNAGEACNPFAPAPCAPGLGCIDGFCRWYCDIASMTGVGDAHCEVVEPGTHCVLGDGHQYGYCIN